MDACLPLVQQINNARTYCYDYNYKEINKDVPIFKSMVVWIGHRMVTVISIPANLIAVGILPVGMTGSSLLALVKIAVYIFSGHKLNFSTGFCYFGKAWVGSGLHVFKNIGEIFFEYAYRTGVAFKAVVLKKCKAPWKTLPLIQQLNEVRMALRKKEEPVSSWFAHKGITLINIPANIGAIAISSVGLVVSFILIAVKVSLYVSIGLPVVKCPTGFEIFGKAWIISAWHIFRNIGEIAKDALILVGDFASLCGMKGALERARAFASDAFSYFVEAL